MLKSSALICSDKALIQGFMFSGRSDCTIQSIYFLRCFCFGNGFNSHNLSGMLWEKAVRVVVRGRELGVLAHAGHSGLRLQ